ncbi:MAG: MlaD family protein [Yoonia sp.]|nr:MlaD family protein [Yoonia sp.]
MPSDQNQSPANMDVRAVKRPIWQRISIVWIVPVLALIVSLGVAYQNYANQGVAVEITFENAAGMAAGETLIKYRDVTVGSVEKVAFADGLADVVVHARIDQNIAPYLDDDAMFWVVRPDVSLRGISGLDTVLGGVYIEGNWDKEADVAQTSFIGLETPPLTRADQPGTIVTLRAPDGSALAKGAPLLHKGIQVGYLETPDLAFNGKDVIVSAFIEAPYDAQVTSNTRFWDTSGFSVKFGTGGVSLDVNSLASLIEGGIAFDTMVSGGRPVVQDQVFDLFPDEETARSSLFARPNQAVLNVSVLFEQSVSGLSVGSEVRFNGIRIGEVTDLSASVMEVRGVPAVRLRANLAIEPARLGLGEDATPADASAFLADYVARGLRARMITGNILSGSLQVELLEIANARPQEMTTTDDGYDVIPTTKSEITVMAATAEGVLDRINNLPVEELMTGAIDMMDSFERLANDESLRAAPASLTALLDEARGLIANEDIQAVPAEVRGAVTDVRQSLANLNAIMASADEQQIVMKLAETLETANTAIANIEESTRNLPQITAQIEAIIAKANALELDSLVANATATLASIDTLIGSDATAELPASLSAALDEMMVFLAEVRKGGAIENVNAALQSASEAAKAIETSVQGLPDLSSRASRLVTETEAVIASFGERSRFSAETLGTLRDIQSAADAVTNLARTIQRNPSSLLTGR